jgi:hypothetical protein
MVGGKGRENLCCTKAGNKIVVVRRQSFWVLGDAVKAKRHVRHEF